MTEPLSPSEVTTLRQQIRTDMVVDTLGNIAFALGIWGWFGEPSTWNTLLREPPVFIGLCALGILNLLHMPKRFRRLREWKKTQSQQTP